tara:strand:- start:715 stop:1212 length:498 start_codon:yes stop_codon:yes gene_type:complete
MMAMFVVLVMCFGCVEVKAHNYYVSICTMDFNEKASSLELTFKLIAHDFEEAIREAENVNLRLGEENQSDQATSIIKDYITEHFQVYTDDETKRLNFVGMEVELDESLYLYFEIQNVKTITEVVVVNTILTDRFDEQENLFYLNAGQIKISEVFNKSITRREINL